MKKILTIFSCMGLCLTLFACSSKSTDSTYTTESMHYDSINSDYFNTDYNISDSFNTSTSELTSEKNTEISQDTKIIYMAYINYETKDFDKAIELLKTQIEKYNGYIIDSTTNKYGDNNQYIDGNFEIRIPAENYKAFIKEKDSIGEITTVNESADDITDEYIDLTARLDTLKTEEETVKNLLSKATEISDILEIESKLSEIRSDIESYESRIKYYDTVTDYATITINISQVNVYTSNKSFLEKCGDLFSDSFKSFKVALFAGFSALIYALPYLVIIAVVIFIVLKVRKNKHKEVNKCEDLEK